MSKSWGSIEEGIATFSGQSEKDVYLSYGFAGTHIQVFQVDASTSTDAEADKPSRTYGSIALSAEFITGGQIRIYTSAPFHGTVHWKVWS